MLQSISRPWRTAIMLVMLLLGTLCGESSAHEGPPFALFMDKPCGVFRVSLWADPDIGDAQFYVVVESPDGSMPAEEPRVAIWTQPTSGRLDRRIYPANRQTLRNRMQFEAKPYFDQQDFWKIGVRLTGADGEQRELLSEVESTPPGLGPWDLAIYSFPFLLIGALWITAMIRRRQSVRKQFPCDGKPADSRQAPAEQVRRSAADGGQ